MQSCHSMGKECSIKRQTHDENCSRIQTEKWPKERMTSNKRRRRRRSENPITYKAFPPPSRIRPGRAPQSAGLANTIGGSQRRQISRLTRHRAPRRVHDSGRVISECQQTHWGDQKPGRSQQGRARAQRPNEAGVGPEKATVQKPGTRC